MARIFATEVPLPPGQRRPELTRLIPITADTWDEALTKAARLLNLGAVVWRIEDRSLTLDEPEGIVTACQTRGLLPHRFQLAHGRYPAGEWG